LSTKACKTRNLFLARKSESRMRQQDNHAGYRKTQCALRHGQNEGWGQPAATSALQ
jgi:hypothetical protein